MGGRSGADSEEDDGVERSTADDDLLMSEVGGIGGFMYIREGTKAGKRGKCLAGLGENFGKERIDDDDATPPLDEIFAEIAKCAEWRMSSGVADGDALRSMPSAEAGERPVAAARSDTFSGRDDVSKLSIKLEVGELQERFIKRSERSSAMAE